MITQQAWVHQCLAGPFWAKIDRRLQFPRRP